MKTLLILGSKPDPTLPPTGSFQDLACANASEGSGKCSEETGLASLIEVHQRDRAICCQKDVVRLDIVVAHPPSANSQKDHPQAPQNAEESNQAYSAHDERLSRQLL